MTFDCCCCWAALWPNENSLEFHRLSNCSRGLIDFQPRARPVCFDEKGHSKLSLRDSWAFCLQLSRLIQNKLPSVVHNQVVGVSISRLQSPGPNPASSGLLFNGKCVFLFSVFQLKMQFHSRTRLCTLYWDTLHWKCCREMIMKLQFWSIPNPKSGKED